MATRKPKDTDVRLPFAALQLLAPPVRLVSAALWKVLKQRDVMQYGVVEEFVTLACDTVPGLLTVRHQGKLTLGLRGRLILELLQTQPDAKVIEPHMKRIRVPAAPSSSLAASVKNDIKIARTVESFHLFVDTLLTNPAGREQFFKEEFPADYGPKFDDELEKLLWEFLVRLDQLLPVPSLAQTVSWLSDAPPVLEECARSATQPQLLNILLQHQSCLGHLEPAASLPPNMGDSILDSLSLPPSGRVPSNQGGATKSAGDQSGRSKTPFITPVIGLISNKDVPIMASTSRRAVSGDQPATSKDSLKFTGVKQRQKLNNGAEKGKELLEGESDVSKRDRGMKRKLPDNPQSELDEEEVAGTAKSGKRKMNSVGQVSEEQLRLPGDPSLCSLYESCLRRQPRVVIEKVPVASSCARTSESATFFYKKESQRTRSPVTRPMYKSTRNQPQNSDDKENHPFSPSVSGSPHRRTPTETPGAAGESEDYVADSEDEATKNFKGRLFTKRYYKTKHGTYVPTLREYWKPGVVRRVLLCAGSKHR